MLVEVAASDITEQCNECCTGVFSLTKIALTNQKII